MSSIVSSAFESAEFRQFPGDSAQVQNALMKAMRQVSTYERLLRKLAPFVHVPNRPSQISSALCKSLQVGWERMRWAKGYSLLHYVAECSDDLRVVEIIALLAGDLNRLDAKGFRPIDYAKQNQCRGVARVIERLQVEKLTSEAEQGSCMGSSRRSRSCSETGSISARSMSPCVLRSRDSLCQDSPHDFRCQSSTSNLPTLLTCTSSDQAKVWKEPPMLHNSSVQKMPTGQHKETSSAEVELASSSSTPRTLLPGSAAGTPLGSRLNLFSIQAAGGASPDGYHCEPSPHQCAHSNKQEPTCDSPGSDLPKLQLPLQNFGTNMSTHSSPRSRCTATSSELETGHCAMPSAREVRFRSFPSYEQDFTPYAEKYGAHPKSFHFDSGGFMVPARSSQARSYDVANQQMSVRNIHSSIPEQPITAPLVHEQCNDEHLSFRNNSENRITGMCLSPGRPWSDEQDAKTSFRRQSTPLEVNSLTAQMVFPVKSLVNSTISEGSLQGDHEAPSLPLLNGSSYGGSYLPNSQLPRRPRTEHCAHDLELIARGKQNNMKDVNVKGPKQMQKTGSSTNLCVTVYEANPSAGFSMSATVSTGSFT